MRQESRSIKNQKGQVVIEAVLLMVVLFFTFRLVVTGLQKARFVQSFTEDRWSVMSGMIECGVWKPCSGKPGLHPVTRLSTLDPTTL